MTADPLADLDFEPAALLCECPACGHHALLPQCGAPAVWKMGLHDIHSCTKPDLDPSGAAVRLVCDTCLYWHTQQAETLAMKARQVYAQTGGVLACRTCQRPLTDVSSFLTVERYGPAPE